MTERACVRPADIASRRFEFVPMQPGDTFANAFHDSFDTRELSVISSSNPGKWFLRRRFGAGIECQ
jgi:hypothetical protein